MNFVSFFYFFVFLLWLLQQQVVFFSNSTILWRGKNLSWLKFDQWLELDLGSNLTHNRVWFPECTCHLKEPMVRNLKTWSSIRVFFFQVSSPTFQKRIQSKIPSNQQRNKASLNIKSWKKKKKERKTSASLKLVTLISYPLNNSSMSILS